MRLTLRALAALPLVASCHSGPAPLRDRTAAEVLAAARAARTARVTATERIETDFGSAEASAEGVVDVVAGRSSMRVDATELFQIARLDEVVDGPTTYLHRPSRPGWLRFHDPDGSGVHPTAAVAYLAGADPLTRAGVEVVRGECTVHYTGRATSPTRSFDVWVDAHGLPLRIRTVGGAGPSVTKTFELSGWGAALEVSLPPSSTPVKDVNAAYEGMGAG